GNDPRPGRRFKAMRRHVAIPLAALVGLAIAISPATPTALAQSGVWLSVDRGPGTTYAIGDPITITFSLTQPGYYRLVSITSRGTRVVAEGPSNGTTGTIRSTVGDPDGRPTLRLSLYV